MPDTTSRSAPLSCAESLRYAEWREPSGIVKEAAIEINPDTTQQWSVTFDVLLGDWVIGTDHGIVWFDQQNLYAVGQLTSFAIPGHRIRSEVDRRLNIIRPLQRKFLVPVKGDPQLPVSIQLDVMTAAPFVPENIAFLEALRSCRTRSDPEIEGQLPPVGVCANAHTLGGLQKILLHHSIRVAVVICLCLAFVGLLTADIRLNPFLSLLILAASLFQVWQWGWAKMAPATRAIRSCIAHRTQEG